MFIRKEEYQELTKKIADTERTNKILSNSIVKLEEEKKNIKSDLESEHLENYEQHRKLLAIERVIDGSYGSYSELLTKLKKVQAIIKSELADANPTNSNQ